MGSSDNNINPSSCLFHFYKSVFYLLIVLLLGVVYFQILAYLILGENSGLSNIGSSSKNPINLAHYISTSRDKDPSLKYGEVNIAENERQLMNKNPLLYIENFVRHVKSKITVFEGKLSELNTDKIDLKSEHDFGGRILELERKYGLLLDQIKNLESHQRLDKLGDKKVGGKVQKVQEYQLSESPQNILEENKEEEDIEVSDFEQTNEETQDMSNNNDLPDGYGLQINKKGRLVKKPLEIIERRGSDLRPKTVAPDFNEDLPENRSESQISAMRPKKPTYTSNRLVDRKCELK